MSEERAPLWERFPALGRLGTLYRRRKIPVVQQLHAADCGAACLVMVLGFFGKEVRLEQVREIMAVGRDGVSALSILKAGRWFGLRGRGLKLTDAEELKYLKSPAVLHWEFNHFVVFSKHKGKDIEIIDPALGVRVLSRAEFERAFTGIALELSPANGFERVRLGNNPLKRYARRLLEHRPLLTRIALTSLLIQLFSLSLPAATGVIVDRVLPRSDSHLLWVLGAGVAMILSFRLVTSLIRSHLLLALRTHLDMHMGLGFMEHLVDLPYSFFQVRSTGDLMMRLNSNQAIREILTSTTISSIIDGTLVIGYLFLLFWVSPAMAWLVLTLALLHVGSFLFFRGGQRELLAKMLHIQAKSQGTLVQLLAGVEDLKASGSEHRAVMRWSDFYVDELNVSIERGRMTAVTDAVEGLLNLGAPIAILLFGATQVLSGQMMLGQMLALSALATGFLMPLSALVGSASRLQLLDSYVRRIDDVLDTPAEQEQSQVRPAPRLRGGIKID